MRKSTDWNWGLNEKSREARRVWPDLGVYAIVSPGAAAGTWYWRIYPQIPGHGPVRGGTARSSDAAKRGASDMVRDLIAPARRNPAPSVCGWGLCTKKAIDGYRCHEHKGLYKPHETRGGILHSAPRLPIDRHGFASAQAKRGNPALGMPGMPHTWVTKGGVHVSGGDTIEYWSGSSSTVILRDRFKARGKVNRMLVFDDHVIVNKGWAGEYVDDDNFIRVVKKATRKNPSGARRSSVSKEWRWA